MVLMVPTCTFPFIWLHSKQINKHNTQTEHLIFYMISSSCTILVLTEWTDHQLCSYGRGNITRTQRQYRQIMERSYCCYRKLNVKCNNLRLQVECGFCVDDDHRASLGCWWLLENQTVGLVNYTFTGWHSSVCVDWNKSYKCVWECVCTSGGTGGGWGGRQIIKLPENSSRSHHRSWSLAAVTAACWETEMELLLVCRRKLHQT